MTFVVLALLVALGLLVYSLCVVAGRASQEEERLRTELEAFSLVMMSEKERSAPLKEPSVE